MNITVGHTNSVSPQRGLPVDHTFTRLIACSLLALCLGCVEDTNSNPPTYQVRGTVTYQNKPVAGASILFNKPDRSRGAVGKTDEQGVYQLTTYALNDGAPPGEYRIQIMKYEELPMNATEAQMYNLKNQLPAKYADAKKSGLSANVKESDDNVIDFALQ
ncbi:MAG: carboxypeptidase regulatory-like domain-containing protein [Pirellulaceae bacterium]|nr:carboxypeptidase regulatory-like domain-containing protein [Pirellulaceae bacterium]